MGEGDVERIAAILGQLEPVRIREADDARASQARLGEEVETRQQRRGRRSHIGEDEPAQLLDRIGALAHMLFQIAAGQDAGRVEYLSLSVVEPAVIAAPQTLEADRAEAEIGAAMGAARLDQTHPSAAIAEEDQILAQDADKGRFLLEVIGDRHRPPIAPQHLAHGRACGGRSEDAVLFGGNDSRIGRHAPPQTAASAL